jgi:hypothetical protein
MGIAADLQYSFPPPNLVQRLGQRFVSSRGRYRQRITERRIRIFVLEAA